MMRRGDVICVTTYPGPPTLDGGERVSIVRGVVVGTVQGDSIGCGKEKG